MDRVDNPMAKGSGDAYSNSLGDYVTAGHLALARKQALSDMEAWTNAMAFECRDHCCVDSDYALRVMDRLRTADTSTVMHAMLTAAYAVDVAAARDELVRRYLAAEDARVTSLAQSYADGAA